MRSFTQIRRGAAVVLTLAVALLGLVAWAPAASAAHAKLSSTSPAAGGAVPVAPSVVQLTFTGNVISMGLQMQVIGPTGLVTSGRPVVDRATVTQPLAASLVNGSYVVNWRVVHDDGHPDAGTFSFTVAVPGGPTAAPGQRVSVAPLPPPAAPVEGLPPVWVGVGLMALIVPLVVAVVLDRRRRSAEVGGR